MLFLSTLGATSVLSIVNIGFGGKSRPHVGYATALDTFIILCFIAVFAALVEFACINFIDTFVKRRKKKQEDLKIQSEQKKEQQIKKASAKIFTENSICTSPVVIEEDITNNVDEENSNLSAITSSRDMEKSELLSETSNTMTLEQFTDIVLASEGMTLNNNNECTNSSLGLGYEAATPNPKIGGITQVNDKKVIFT